MEPHEEPHFYYKEIKCGPKSFSKHIFYYPETNY